MAGCVLLLLLQLLRIRAETDAASRAGHTHEASWNEPNGPRPYVTYDDDTLADFEKTEPQNRWVFNDYRIALPKQEHKGDLSQPRRIVQKGRHPMGSQAYVLTLKGATKMLYHVNHVPL